MIDLAEIEFTESDGDSPSQKRVVAVLKIKHEAVVDSANPVPISEIRELLRAAIAYKIFGKLRRAVTVLLSDNRYGPARDDAEEFLKMFKPEPESYGFSYADYLKWMHTNKDKH